MKLSHLLITSLVTFTSVKGQNAALCDLCTSKFTPVIEFLRDEGEVVFKGAF
jgi:hypothetical protein